MIKGLTDRPQLHRLGKIKLGSMEPTRDGTGTRPKSADHFLLPPEVEAVYGPEALEIEPVYFTSNDEDVAASTYYRMYGRRGLLCKGDGETAWRTVEAQAHADWLEMGPAEREAVTVPIASPDADPDSVMRAQVACPCPLLDSGDCKALMMMQFLLPRVPGFGIWQLDTSSSNSIRQVWGAMGGIKAMTGGKLAMIPLRLHMELREFNPTGNQKFRAPVVDLSLASGWTVEHMIAQIASRIEPLASLTAGVDAPDPVLATAELPAPDDEAPEELTASAEQIANARREAAAAPPIAEGPPDPHRGPEATKPDMDRMIAARTKAGISREVHAQEWVHRYGHPTTPTLAMVEEMIAWLEAGGPRAGIAR